MLSVLLAMALQTMTNPADTATCLTQSVTDGRYVSAQRVLCPEDVTDAEALQRLADQLVSRIEYPVRVRRDQYATLDREVEFVREEGIGWHLSAPIAVIAIVPQYPRASAMRNVEGRCDVRLTAYADGTASDVVFRCDGYRRGELRRRGNRLGDTVERDIVSSRWLIPLGLEQACAESFYTFALDQGSHSRDFLEVPVEDAPTCAIED